MNITSTQVYRTSDGTLHEKKIDAVNHERFLEIRGLLQTAAGRRDTVTLSEVAKILIGEKENLNRIFSSYNRTLGQLAKSH